MSLTTNQIQTLNPCAKQHLAHPWDILCLVHIGDPVLHKQAFEQPLLPDSNSRSELRAKVISVKREEKSEVCFGTTTSSRQNTLARETILRGLAAARLDFSPCLASQGMVERLSAPAK